MRAAISLQRAIVVQPTGYGFDNRCTLAAIEQLGPETRGVAVVPPGVPRAELERLHHAGVRGVRYMMLAGGLLGWDSLAATAAAIAPLGWHINLQLDGCTLPQHEAALQALPCALVIDHIGKFLGPAPPEGDAMQVLQRLLDRGRCWIKLSAPYESSRSGPPDYADVAPRVHALARGWPERCLWASNWPHPNVVPTPDNAALLAWAEAAVDNAATWRRMLVDNPAALYGFDAG